MSTSAPEPDRSLTDSPWFWFFVFGLAGLVALLVIAPKHFRRQERLVRMQHARDASDAYRNHEEFVPPENREEPGEEATVRTLIVFLLVVLLVVGQVLLIQRRRRRLFTASRPPPSESGGR
jgi:hypothetical protein